jgi:hypothetical protein
MMSFSSSSSSSWFWFCIVTSCLLVRHDSSVWAFTGNPRMTVGIPERMRSTPLWSSPKTVRYAGGFEWEDPLEEFDQAVDNPFKNPDLMNSEEGLKIDPARLLGPRLNGSNLYLIGMMGSGKSSVGDKVARRK